MAFSLEHLVFPTDFSDEASQVAVHAEAWAQRFGAELHLIHVRGSLRDAGLRRDSFPAFDEYEKHVETQSRHGLDAVTIRDGITVHREVVTAASSAGGILQYAKTVAAGLIVMGRKGDAAIKRLLLGSATDEVVRLSQRSVLVVPVRPPAGPAFTTIFAGDDLSDASMVGLRHAVEIARAASAKLVVATVADPTSHPAFHIAGSDSVFDYLPELKNGLRTTLRERLATADVGDLDCDVVIAEGRVAAKLRELAREHDASLVVCSATGLGTGPNRILGSVAGKLLRTASSPVLLAR